MLLSAAGIAFSTSHTAAVVGCLIFGIASGAAMIPYTIVKEVNPDEVKGSATGAINFLTFGVTALIGPIFADHFGKGIASTQNHVAHFRAGGVFWMVSIVLAILLSCVSARDRAMHGERHSSGLLDMKTVYISSSALLVLGGVVLAQDSRSAPQGSHDRHESSWRGAGPP